MSQIIDQLNTLSITYSWQRFAIVKTSCFVTQRRTVKKLRPRPIKDSFTDDLKLLQRLSISLCNPCTPQNSIPPEDDFLNFYENLSPPTVTPNLLKLSPYDTNYTKMLSKTINSTNEETFVSSLNTPIIPTSSKVDDFEASSDEEFVIERGHTVVDLCSDTSSLDNVNSISQLQSTVKLSGKKNVRKRELSKSNRDRVSSDMFKSFNEMVFDNKLPEMLPISWNSRLLKTAGLTHCKETVEAKNRAITRHASIEISVKVIV
jgi:hypothetical protein